MSASFRSTARPLYNLIASVSVNSLSALQLDSKQSDNRQCIWSFQNRVQHLWHQTISPVHLILSGSDAALTTSENAQCIWWHQHQMQSWLFHQISHQHLNQAHLLRLSKWSFQRLRNDHFKRSFSCTLNESN